MSTSKTNRGLLLQRMLSGQNVLSKIEITDSEKENCRIEEGPAIINFAEFLKNWKLDYHEAVVELAQILKIPYEKMAQFAEDKQNSYVTVDASKNIKAYLRVRANPVLIDFLQSQSGEAGILNKPVEKDYYHS